MLEPEPKSKAPKVLGVLLLLAASFGLGFYAGRRTAPRPKPAEAAAAPPAPAPVAAAAPAAPAGGGASTAPVASATPAPAVPVAAPTAAPVNGLPANLRRLSATLQGPLEDTVERALPDADKAQAEPLTQVVNRLIVWHLQIARDGRPGDRLEVLWEPVAGQEPVVHALRYESQKLGHALTAYRWKAPGAKFARYYQEDGDEVEERLVGGPIGDYEQVTSLLKDGRHHKGVDFKTPEGTTVLAPFDGTIEKRNWHFGMNGNCLELLDAKSGRHAIFLHLDPIPRDMAVGRHVKAGEAIALSGNTGHSTAPHLHYQLEAPDGRVLDPFSIHATKRLALDPAARGEFDVERKRLDGLLNGAAI